MKVTVEPAEYKRRQPVADYVRAHGPEWPDWLQDHRIELNAMTTPQLIEWLDRKMEEHGHGRLVPPAEVLALTGTNTGVLAVSTFGTGRMSVVSDDSDLWDDTIDPKYDWTGQRHAYAVNIFKWLLLYPPQLSQSLWRDADGWHLSLQAEATQTVRLQRSTDLVTWTDWKTVTATGTSQDVLDDDAAPPGAQFYRAVLQP